MHRVFECPYMEARATFARPEWVHQEWERRGRGGDGAIRAGENAMEWERSLVHGPVVCERRTSGWFECVVEPACTIVGAEVFLDGSMYDNFDDRFTALGWAFAVVVEGKVVELARGGAAAARQVHPCGGGVGFGNGRRQSRCCIVEFLH